MSVPIHDLLVQLLATDAPALPLPHTMHIGLQLGWGVLLAWLGVELAVRWWPDAAVGRRWWLVAALALGWACLPGAWSVAYWLGLAFQAPSDVAVLLCISSLVQRLWTPGVAPVGMRMDRYKLLLACFAVLLGWALLLDAFALLPVQLYAWGFSPLASGVVLLVALLPWVVGLGANTAPARRPDVWLVPAALLVFVLWRLPTGNVWDAMLDPLLWIALQVYLLRSALAK